MTEAPHERTATLYPVKFAATIALLLLALASPGAHAADGSKIMLGIDVLLSERIELVQKKRVGLITNPSGVDARGIPTVDRLMRDARVELVQLFGPEHGIRGEVDAGDRIEDEIDPITGLAVESLYGASRRPSAESLAKIDVLLFDIQDVGSRTYTYVSTLGEAMIAATEAGVPVIVLDRPNPLGGEVFEGPVRDEEWKSFIGWGPVPVTHGLTVAELARLFDGEMDLGCELSVVPMKGWKRSMQWEDTGLTWVQTSPHIPHALQAHLYVSTGMIGGVTDNVNEGVGYTLPFETIAAEFLDPNAFAEAMNAAHLPGVRFRPIAYIPYYGRHQGLALRGARLELVDRRAFRPLRTAITVMTVLERMHPGEVAYKAGRPFAIHWGNEEVLALIRAGKSAREIEASWEADLRAFQTVRGRYLLY